MSKGKIKIAHLIKNETGYLLFSSIDDVKKLQNYFKFFSRISAALSI